MRLLTHTLRQNNGVTTGKSRSRHRLVTLLAVALIVSVATPLATTTPAAAAAADYLDETFAREPSQWTQGWYDATIGNRNRITRISDGADGSAARVTITPGSHFGSAARWQFADHGFADPDELYFRYYLRFPEGYVNYGKGKLPGFGGLYSSSGRNNIKPSDANPGWSARMYFSPTVAARNADHTRIGFYIYHRDQPADHGDLDLWDTATAELRHGSWYCVEGHVAMNTPGLQDGALTGWVDEKLAFYRGDVRFRGATDTTMGVESFWFDTYYGGTETAPGTLSIDFDSLELSSERVGCGGRAPGSFRDTGGSTHRTNIARLAHAGITRGCNPPDNDLFCPGNNVTRGQMAAFLGRALDLAPSDTNRFSDDDDSVFEADINALAAAGITQGCDAGIFCPDRSVTRGEMAAFLDRALRLAPTGSDFFTDDDGSVFASAINRLAAAGITAGCNPPANDRYCPTSRVTRAQMATFLSRALGLPDPPPAPDGVSPVVIPPGFDAVVPPGGSIQATIDMLPQGSAIYLEAGLHPRQQIEPTSGQTIVGAPGTVLDGQGETGYAFVSQGPGAADNVTIRGVEITGYDPAHNEGAVQTDGTGWVVEDCDIHHNENFGAVVGDGAIIRNCHIHHNRQGGIYLNGVANARIEANEIDTNNHLDDDDHSVSGGVELRATTNLTVVGNHVHDNHGHGLWAAQDTINTVYDTNVIESNYRSGIYHKQSYLAVISNNIVRNNGTTAPPNTVKDAGIMVGGPDVEVTGNTVTNNHNGITFINSVPRTGLHGWTAIRNANVHNNTVIDSGNSGVSSSGDPAALSTATFEGNVYRYPDISATWWFWEAAARTWDQWQTLGNDLLGSVEVL